MKKKILILLFFLFAFFERVWFDLGPNIELITLATMLSAFYLDRKITFIFLIGTMFLSDLVIGNTNIFLFTWSGFLIPAFVVSILPKLKSISKPIAGTLAGVGSTMFFYFWTNFGVWAMDSWGMYPKTIQGLILSYVNALPFLKNQLISTLIFVPLGFVVFNVLLSPTSLYSKLVRGQHKVAY